MPSVKNLAKLLCVLEKRSNLQKSYLKQKSFVRNLYGKRYGRSPAVIRIPYYCGALCRDEATRTPDPYVPNVVRYQLRYIPIFRFFLTITSSGFARHRSFAGANSRLPRSPSSFSTKINFKKLFSPERNFGFIVVIGHLQEQTPVFLAHPPCSRQK